MKITKYFIDKARYRAEDEAGNIIWLDVNYWENNFRISERNLELESFAKKLLIKKHKVNFVEKLLE